jgi:hypothetical protein
MASGDEEERYRPSRHGQIACLFDKRFRFVQGKQIRLEAI